MRLRNLGVLGLSAICLLACAKEVSKDEAKTFIDTNYKTITTDIKKLTKIKFTADFSESKGDEIKKELNSQLKSMAEKYKVNYNDGSLKLAFEDSDSTTLSFFSYIAETRVKSDDLDKLSSDNLKFTVKGKELTVISSRSYEYSGIKYVSKQTAIYNDFGQPRYMEQYDSMSSDNNNAAVQKQIFEFTF